jgi:dihydroflavonol-4-reductase
MRYLVTGATGFIGGAVTRQLVEDGHEVVALVRSLEKAAPLAALGVTLCQGDITDQDSLRAPMTGVDGVFHLAAYYEIGTRRPRLMSRVNVDGTRHVLTVMKESGVPRGVYTSTVGVFSDTHGRVVDETHRHEGPFLSAYEQTKWQAHYRVALPMMAAGLPLVIVVPGLVYGPGDTSIVRRFVLDYLRGRLRYALAETAFSWGHVDDIARGHILAMERGIPGETYILAGEAVSFLEALRMGERITGIPVPRLVIRPGVLKALARVMSAVERIVPVGGMLSSEVLRTFAGATYLAFGEKARRDLGFVARPLETGFRELAAYERERLS